MPGTVAIRPGACQSTRSAGWPRGWRESRCGLHRQITRLRMDGKPGKPGVLCAPGTIGPRPGFSGNATRCIMQRPAFFIVR